MNKVPFHLCMLRGAIGKRFVVKHYGRKVVVTRYPDMKGIRASSGQRLCRRTFSQAVCYARSILKDRVKREAFARRIPKGACVYHRAIREYMAAARKTRAGVQAGGLCFFRPVVALSYCCLVQGSFSQQQFSVYPAKRPAYADTG